MLHKTLIVCLPLLAFTACKPGSKKSNNAANPTPVAEAIKDNNAALESKNVATPPVVTQSIEGTVAIPTEGAGKTDDSKQNQNQNAPSLPEAKPECETLVIDFDKGPNGATLKSGELLNDQYAAWGVSFVAHKNLSNGTTVYDVKPVTVQTTQTGLAASPDVPENTRGGYVKLVFAKPTSIINADFFDVDNSSSEIELFTMKSDGKYESKSKQAIPQKADKETANLSVDDHSYIRKMTIKFTASSAIDNIKICIKN